jgi:hypothetical protein
MEGSMMNTKLVMTLMVMPPCSKPSFFPYFNCVMEVLVEIYGGDRAPTCQDVMELLMAARVPLPFHSPTEVGFAFWVTPHQICPSSLTNVVWFDKTVLTEGDTGIRYSHG